MSVLTSILRKLGHPNMAGGRRGRPPTRFRPRLEALEGRIVPAADLLVNITGPATIAAGADVVYPITVSNLGPGTATGVNVSYTLPGVESLVSFNAPSNFALVPFANVTYNLRAHINANAVPQIHPLTTSTSVSSSTADPNSTNNTDSVSSTLVRSADLAVTVTGPSTVVAGTSATYRVTFTNNGPSDVPNANLTYSASPNVTLTSYSLVSGPPVGGTLASGQSQVFDEVFAVGRSIANGTPITVSFQPNVSTSDPNTGNNAGSITSTVNASARLGVSMTGPSTAPPGANATYQITLTNLGPSDAQSVSLVDVLTFVQSYVSATQTAGPAFTAIPPQPPIQPGLPPSPVMFTISTFAAGATATFQVVDRIATNAIPGSTVINRATVSSPTPDPFFGSRSDMVSTIIPLSPAVTTQPLSQTIGEGQPVTFAAVASGAPAPTIQWQVESSNLSGFADVPGQIGGSLTFTAAVTQNGNRYRAVFTNAGGTVNSDPATLTVVARPIGTAFTVNVVRDTFAQFTLPASDPNGRPITLSSYTQPQHGTVTQIANTFDVKYTPTAGYLGQDSFSYVVSNGFALSNPATVSINDYDPAAVILQPATQTIGEGLSVTFAAAATGSPAPTVQWQVSTNGGTTFTNVGGATGNTLSFTTILGQNGNRYRAVFDNGFSTATSNAAMLTVTARPAVQSVVVDIGTAQRSVVRSVTVSFSGVVSFAGPAANAFQLTRAGPGASGDVTLAVDLSGSTAAQTVARLSFSGPLAEGANSLVDGNYTLTVHSAQVTGGLPGGDSVSSLFRLFGDVNGDKAVNGLDLAAFRGAFGSVSGDAGYASVLDFNGDGTINGTDLAQFRSRFGVILP
ncbi:MAG TPA: Ig-like domain-containing protein [Gemmataceae bacterium]|nr:Ig-like domain-containing protein [Gemmataceae bacterium]